MRQGIRVPTSATLVDILQSVFGQDEGYGAVLVTSTSPSLALLAETSTGGEAGSFGQSLPLFGSGDLVLEGTSRNLAPIREDGAFRTNLILASASEAPCDIDLRLFAEGGSLLGSRRVPLPPLGMTQLSRVARQLGVATDLRSARLAVSVATPGCRVAATASGIDEATNDPRTLLPR